MDSSGPSVLYNDNLNQTVLSYCFKLITLNFNIISNNIVILSNCISFRFTIKRLFECNVSNYMVHIIIKNISTQRSTSCIT